MADCSGLPFRRRLRSAERLRDTAMARGLVEENTLGSRSSALLAAVTRPDQREFLAGMLLAFRVAFFLVLLENGARGHFFSASAVTAVFSALCLMCSY